MVIINDAGEADSVTKMNNSDLGSKNCKINLINFFGASSNSVLALECFKQFKINPSAIIAENFPQTSTSKNEGSVMGLLQWGHKLF